MKRGLRQTIKRYCGFQTLEDLYKWRFVGWPERGYILIPEHRLIYCPIPKNACTTVQRWLYSLMHSQQPSDIHEVMGKRFILGRRGLEAIRALQRPDYFRFAIVRNPWRRVVSAFCDKVVRLGIGLAGDLTRNDSIRHLTFREFVQIVRQTAPLDIDGHLQPQHLFLGTNRFDALGRFETLDRFLARLADRFGLPPTWGSWNRVDYRGELPDRTLGCVADWSVEELRSLERVPRYDAFYDDRLIAQVRDYYRHDVDAFGYTFAGVTSDVVRPFAA